MSEPEFPWKGDGSAAPCEGTRLRDADPGRRVVAERIAEREREAQPQKVPVRPGNPMRRWK